MKVARYYGRNDIRIEEMPVPEIGAGEVLLRTRASGVCGSDVMHWYRAGRGPIVLGHEVAGEVIAVGEEVTSCKTGDRICAAHHVPCNTCHYCLTGHHTVCDMLRATNFDPGGFSEYIRLPRVNVDRGVFVLPETLSYEEGTFVEPLACVYRGQRIAGTAIGKSVLVIGSGISGILHIMLAKVLGASIVVASDVSQYRIGMAKRMGADAAVHAESDVPGICAEMSGRPADIVILTSGAEKAIAQAFRAVGRGGTILFFAPAGNGVAVPLPVNDLFWRSEITLTSSYAANHQEHAAALELIRQGRINVRGMITHRMPLEGTAEAFGLVEEGGESMKVIIEP